MELPNTRVPYAASNVHLKLDIKYLSAELPYTEDHGEFEVDLLYDIVSTAKRCSSSQSVPGSGRPVHPPPPPPHLALVVLICSKLCLNAPD